GEAAFRTLQRYAAFDILSGLASAGHETHEWLTAAGFPADALRRLSDDPVTIDVIGLDYYPETEHDFDVDASGEPVLTTAAAPVGLANTALEYHRRYGRPLFVAESSASGSDERRRDWIAWNVAEMQRATAAGVDILGYTWWPLFDHIDWNTLLQERSGFVCPAGLYHLQPTKHDRTKYDRLATAAVDDFRRAADADRRLRGELAGRAERADGGTT
ncbi:MAG TPA: family 1 glycosylhydrolase, partial [Trueperaceae bacterium]|nr:family 1 glycosylhydrolase [Trueperaceae bacterium]